MADGSHEIAAIPDLLKVLELRGALVTAVADAAVEATLPFLTAPVRTMVQIQRLTGGRPGEVVILSGDVD